MRLAPKLYCARWLVIQANVLILVSVDIKCEGRGARGPCDTLFMTDLGGRTCITVLKSGYLMQEHYELGISR